MRSLIPWKKHKKEKNKVDYTYLNPHGEIDNLSDKFFGINRELNNLFFENNLQSLGVEISENNKMIIVKAELSGMNPNELEISLHGRMLTIKGEKRNEDIFEKERFYQSEISYGFFNRRIQLPTDVDQSCVDASYKKGVLRIKMEKTKTAQRKTIKVTEH